MRQIFVKFPSRRRCCQVHNPNDALSPFWNGANWWLIHSANTQRNGRRLNSYLIRSSINYLSYNFQCPTFKGLYVCECVCILWNDVHCQWFCWHGGQTDYAWCWRLCCRRIYNGNVGTLFLPTISSFIEKWLKCTMKKTRIQVNGMHYQCVSDGFVTFASATWWPFSISGRTSWPSFEVVLQDRWLHLEYTLHSTTKPMR